MWNLLSTAWNSVMKKKSTPLFSNRCLDGFIIAHSLWSSALNGFHHVSVMPLTFCLEWWSSGCRTDWTSHTYRDKVHQPPVSILCLAICDAALTKTLSVPTDDLLSTNEKPPVSNKEVMISVSVQTDSDSCPSKTTSSQSSPVIIRGKWVRRAPNWRSVEKCSSVHSHKGQVIMFPSSRLVETSLISCDVVCSRDQISSEPGGPAPLGDQSAVQEETGQRNHRRLVVVWRRRSVWFLYLKLHNSPSSNVMLMCLAYPLSAACLKVLNVPSTLCLCLCRSDSAHSLPADQQEQVGWLQDPCLYRRQDQPHWPRPASVSHVTRRRDVLVRVQKNPKIFFNCRFQNGHAAEQVQDRLLRHQRPRRYQHQTPETQVRVLKQFFLSKQSSLMNSCNNASNYF